MSIEDILDLPYIMFVIGMLDAPSLSKEKKDKVRVPQSKEDEINSIMSIL